jgi:hypothetical protein
MWPVFTLAGLRGRDSSRQAQGRLSAPLRSSGFRVELDGVGELHGAFFRESRTRGRW